MLTNTSTKFKETEIGLIPERWVSEKLANICDIQTGPFGSQLHEKDYVEKGTPIITVEHLLHDRIDHDGVIPQVSDEDTKRLSRRYSLKEGDIVFSRVGSVDRSAYVSKDEDGWLFSGRLLRVRPSTPDIDSRWLDCWIRQEIIKEYVRNIAVGATMPSINTSLLGEIPVFIPELSEQKRIAEIISSLDDKIELNRKINADLENLASALFKKWFVDIGDELLEGWRMELMTNHVDIGKGLSYKGADLTDDGESVLVGLKCFERGGGFKISGIKRFSGAFKEQHLLHAGDLIVAMTDLTQGAEVLGKPAIVPNIQDAKHIVASLDVSILRLKTKIISKVYLYLFFMHQETQNFLFGFSNGSTVLHLSIEGLRKIQIPILSEHEMKRFNDLLEPIFYQIQELSDESISLSKIRDSLLPRLMSGKIRTK